MYYEIDTTFEKAEKQIELSKELMNATNRDWDAIGATQRTDEQFLVILNTCENGVYSDASEQCKRYKFQLQELKDKLNEYHEARKTDWEQRYEDLDMITSINL